MALRTTSMSTGASQADNPFGGGGGSGGGTQTTALALANQTQPMGGVMLELPNGSKIRVASEADAQLLRAWYQSQQQQNALSLGGASSTMSMGGETGGTPTTRALRVAADGANALSGFFAGRDFRNKLNDYDDAQEALDKLHDEFRTKAASDPISKAEMLRFLDAQQDLFDAQAAVLETQISAVDIQTGAGVANVVSSFMDSSGSRTSGGGGAGTTIALAGAGVGAALLLSRDSRDRRRRR